MSHSHKNPPTTPLDYRSAGVDIDAGNALVDRIKPLVRATTRPEVLGGLGGFGGLFRLGDRYKDPVLVSGTDGVGTKLLLARALNQHRTIGIDLVAMCVNDILVTGAEPLFFLDYFACGKLEIEQAEDVIAGIAEGCRQAGCALIGGETAEMPGMYAPGDYDLAGFAVGCVERSQLIDGSRIDADCELLGLPSSGPHSNGYSLIRKVLERGDPQHQRAERLLEPTRIYVNAVQPLLQKFDIRGMAHITGGGLTENIIRSVPEHLAVEIDPDSWQIPPIFEWLAETGQIAQDEMRRTFNLGIGFVLIVPREQSQAIIDALTATGEPEPVRLGHIVKAEHGQPRIAYADD